jgi:hypothetical protein
MEKTILITKTETNTSFKSKGLDQFEVLGLLTYFKEKHTLNMLVEQNNQYKKKSKKP